ncbi:UNVERIFIED_CONTAM: hypothetical protein FKN15_071957 [Acipenser sinensis]
MASISKGTKRSHVWKYFDELDEKTMLALELRQKHFDKRHESRLGNAPQPSAGAAPTGTRNKRQCQVAKCNKNRTFDVCARCEKASLWQMHWYR